MAAQAAIIDDPEIAAHYAIMSIVKTMRLSAMMLELADHNNPKYNKLNMMQANLLRAAAKDLASQYHDQLAEIKKIADRLLLSPQMMDEKTSDLVHAFFEKNRDKGGSL